MPELPEVESIIRQLRKTVPAQSIKKVVGHYKPIVKAPWRTFVAALAGQRIETFSRHGKYMFWQLSSGTTLVVHLRMTGQVMVVARDHSGDAHTHLEIFFANSPQKLIYRDVRKFGHFELIPTPSIPEYLRARKLAPDALVITPAELYQQLQRKKTARLKAALLDQRVIAGLGNIYVDEVLIREKRSPQLPAVQLTAVQVKRLLKTIHKVLAEAIAACGTTLSDYIYGYKLAGEFQLQLRAYGQTGKPCYRCGTKIRKTTIAGRGTHYCPKCQG